MNKQVDNAYGYPQDLGSAGVADRLIAEKKIYKRKCSLMGLLVLLSSILIIFITKAFVYAYKLITDGRYLTTAIDTLPSDLITGISSILVFGILGLVFAVVQHSSLNEVFVFDKLSIKRLLAIVTIGFSVCMVSNLLTDILLTNFQNVGLSLGISSDPPLEDSVIEVIVSFLSTAIVPAITEELLFRGTMLATFRKFGDTTAIIATSFLFALMHGNFIQIPFTFVVGLVLSYVVVYTNSMLPAILIHALNNGYSVFASVLRTNAAALGLDSYLVAVMISLPVLISLILSVTFAASLAKKDKNFAKPIQYSGAIDSSDKVKLFLKNPLILSSIVFLFSEAVSVYF